MTFLLLLPAILSFLALGAHYLRQGGWLMVALCMVMPCLLFIRRRFILRALQALLALAFLEWMLTAYDLIQERMLWGRPFLLDAAIIGGVGVLGLLAALLLQARAIQARYPAGGRPARPSGEPPADGGPQ